MQHGQQAINPSPTKAQLALQKKLIAQQRKAYIKAGVDSMNASQKQLAATLNSQANADSRDQLSSSFTNKLDNLIASKAVLQTNNGDGDEQIDSSSKMCPADDEDSKQN